MSKSNELEPTALEALASAAMRVAKIQSEVFGIDPLKSMGELASTVKPTLQNGTDPEDFMIEATAHAKTVLEANNLPQQHRVLLGTFYFGLSVRKF